MWYRGKPPSSRFDTAMKRRDFLAAGLSVPLLARWSISAEPTLVSITQQKIEPYNEDLAFLDDLRRRCYRYFLDASHPTTGLVSDRGATDGSRFSRHASSAACGFGLAAHSVAAKSGLTPRHDALNRVRIMLDSLLNQVDHERGFLYHFFSTSDGSRSGPCEASSIDTAILICGAMTAATEFSEDASITAMTEDLYRRVDWQWMLGKNDLMHMGWTPEKGMLPHQWDSYSELLLLLLVAIGAPAQAIPPRCWNAWRREPVVEFGGRQFLGYPPLFVHQYPFAFFDFRGHRSASGRNYWQNAVIAHEAQIDFMEALGKTHPDRFGHYGTNLWGLTSSDSVDGYRDWGGPYQSGRIEPERGIDGTIVPSAAAGGLSIVPEAALRTLRFQVETYGERAYGPYGFVNAYNPATQWIGPDVIGIDTGISLLMAENLISGGVWESFMAHPSAKRAFDLAGFVSVS
tara:strand:+ start:68803 stop:70179 length:1377 start_codon:yes stop_codon:yes gene_type:complete